MSSIKNASKFREEAHKMADLMADYYEQIENFPVKSVVKPGQIISQLPQSPPDNPESMDSIIHDFNKIIMPGLTHWQHPSFFAYFPANSSFPSVLAEMLTATIAQQGMVWETSPAAAELEERVMEWLKQLCGLPQHWTGVIQDTASASTLAALLSARERLSGHETNINGYPEQKLRIYCTSETHSSIEKAARIAGFGSLNLVKVSVDELFAMNPHALEDAIKNDIKAGFTPCCVVATIGTTGCTAVDPVRSIGNICRNYNLWLHVDAAFAGTALVLENMRAFADGLELADSYVFNPHKWMFTNFDCSAYYVADKETLLKTFEILPEYLKTRSRGLVNDYRDWGVALGRRFRALKLWFVLRNFGVSGIKEKVQLHLDLAKWLTSQIELSNNFELMVPTRFSLVCFRYKPQGVTDEKELDRLNERLLQALNDSGKMYITHTKINGKYTLRLVIAQTYVERRHVEDAWKLINATI
jgi:aromatic-L-amino-acid decarboxylase